MSSYQPRRPAGVPTGGQFATKSHPEPGFGLEVEPTDGHAHTFKASEFTCDVCGIDIDDVDELEPPGGSDDPEPTDGHAHTFKASEFTCDTCGIDIDDVDELEPPGGSDDPEVVAWRAAGISRHEAATWKLVTSYRELPITADEAAKWSGRMRVVRAGQWRGSGFEPGAAFSWSRAGFAEPADAVRWIREGFDDPVSAKEWKAEGFDAPEARSWTDAGFGTATALRWANAGFAPSEAAQALADGHRDPTEMTNAESIARHEAAIWKLVTSYQEPPITADEAAEWGGRMRVVRAGLWRGAGFDSGTAVAWSSAGFSEPYDADRWIRKGFDDERSAKEWKAEGFDAPEARSWVDAEFGTGTALRWANAGFSPSEAAQALAHGRSDPMEVDGGGW